MARNMTVDELRAALNTPDSIAEQEFDIVKKIGLLVNDAERSDTARELLLRVLEHRKQFCTTQPIVEALTRAVGLFPYNDPDKLDLRDRIAYEYHRPLNMGDDFVFHREQGEVYHRLLAGDSVILSAPTSFGKSRIIDAMIATEKFSHIAVIVPTLALIDETRRRLSQFSGRYKIVTHLSQRPGERNIFVLTAERAVAYENFPKIEFFVIDEFYKLDAFSAREDNPVDRTVSLNVAFERLWRMGGQFYLLGPNVKQIPHEVETKLNGRPIFTNFTTVVAEEHRVPKKGKLFDRLTHLCSEIDEPTIIFCSSPSRVNTVAQHLIDANVGVATNELKNAANWAAKSYHEDWIWCKAIINGIGIHHGRLPRAIAQYTVRKFDELKLRFLICTSTLIEGVNTKAKNVIVFDNKIAKNPIDFFTFSNIKGRGGRMFEHFIGHVYLFYDPPEAHLRTVDIPWLTQNNDIPDSLVVQIEEENLKENSRQRLEEWIHQDTLSITVIRQNSGIDPNRQIKLAQLLIEDTHYHSNLLSWNSIPTWDQLEHACSLIWDYLVPFKRYHAGISSGGHLAFKVDQLRKFKEARTRIQNELDATPPYNARTPNEAIQRMLDFERTWATFEFPRYLMALSRIQEHVFGSHGLPKGDYSYFASQVECLFRNPVVAALDEYGIPIQVAERIQTILGTTNDLDVALQNLRSVDLNRLRLDVFERELLEDAKQYL